MNCERYTAIHVTEITASRAVCLKGETGGVCHPAGGRHGNSQTACFHGDVPFRPGFPVSVSVQQSVG